MNFLRGALGALLALIAGYHLFFSGKIYPGVQVAGIQLGGKTEEQARQLLQKTILPPEALILTYNEEEFSIQLEDIYFSYDFTRTVERALAVRQFSKQLPLVYSLEEDLLEENLSTIYQQIEVPAIEPSVSIEKGEVVINQGKEGMEVDTRRLKEKIGKALAQNNKDRLEIPLIPVSPQITDEEAEKLREAARKLLGKRLVLKLEFDTFTYPDEELVGLLALSPSTALGVNSFDQLKIEALVANLAQGVNRPPQNATFTFRDNRVREFTPAEDGVQVREEELVKIIAEKLEELADSENKSLALPIPVLATKPEISTEEVNNLGIKELIGRGSSRFRGSIPNRVHNIGLATSRINGALVAPNEVFSFNAWLGDVSAYTGYRESYIIKDGKTILGDGGGVCQVSTTFFRAALNAGLPILERRQHSYRVSFYEQDSKPGLDATIYSPTVDLKVKNDTPGHILIQSIFNPKNMTLAFEIYGADDGRQVTISTPRVWDVKAPPPPLYQDDPTMPAGTVKQVDFAASGAKVAVDYKVVRGAEVLQEKTFYSNFRPWQAVYLRGTGQQ